MPASSKLMIFSLEFERIWHQFFPTEIDEKQLAEITPEVLRTSIVAGADWIVNMQEKSGRFNYWYNPKTHSFSSKYDDNFLRQAGTSYALVSVNELTGDQKYLDSVLQSVSYQIQLLKNLGSDKAYFMYRNKAKLGGTALPMLTLLKLKKLQQTGRYDELLSKLGEMIIYHQSLYKTGQFKSTYLYKGRLDHEKRTGWESQIYPGEALLALALMYEQFGEEKYKAIFDRAQAFYSDDDTWNWKSMLYWDVQAFSPWVVQALAKMYDLTGDETYSSWAVALTEQMLYGQNLNPDREVYGSFSCVPTVFSSTSLEGLGDALSMARQMGDRALEKRYREHLLMGYHWILKLQYKATDAVPEPAKGGFRQTFYNPQIRIDNTQHAISAMTKGLYNIFHIKPVLPRKNQDV